MVNDSAMQGDAAADLGGDTERARSTISFPYNDLDNGVRVAKAVHQVGGSTCQVEQLGAELKVSPKGGAFSLLLLTAKNFGLVTYGKGSVQLTPLGGRMCDPKQEKAARADAFLNVPLYRAVYERFKGGTLPPSAALESEMANLGVAKKQVSKARQTFHRSAQQSGFFAYGTDRLVMPSAGSGKEPRSDDEPDDAGDEKPRRKNGRGDDDDGSGRHQLIAGLIKTLPQEGSEWATDERGKWLQAAATIFELIYKNTKDGRRMVTVKVEDSAK